MLRTVLFCACLFHRDQKTLAHFLPLQQYNEHGGHMRREIIGLIVVVLALGGWWLWEQQRQLPIPPQATDVTSTINSTIAKETSFTSPLPQEALRGFYRDALAQRGWRYCGDQRVTGCTNLFDAIPITSGTIDVYRRADDSANTGPTIEVWPAPRSSGLLVKVFESKAR